MNRSWIYYALFIAVIAVLAYAEASTPRPVDWSPSYSRNDKIPHGAYALYSLLEPTLVDLRVSPLPIYNTLEDHDLSIPTNYLFVNGSFYPDELDAETLLDFVADGNVAMIAATYFDEAFLDTLGLSTDFRIMSAGEAIVDLFRRDTVKMNFVNPRLRARQPYPIRVGAIDYWFSELDSARVRVLGTNEEGRPNFIRVSHGDGSFYLSSVPQAFTNFNVLAANNARYAFAALSYLPDSETIWDEYYKDGKDESAEDATPLRFVLRNESLRWIYILVCIGTALFVFVHARRRQRAIPIVVPPSNTTLEFAETVGRLYHQHGDHRGIAKKKAAYFHEYLRTRIGLTIEDAGADLHKRIAERSGVSESLIAAIFSRIHYMHRTAEFDADDLKSLNADLEAFYSNTKR